MSPELQLAVICKMMTYSVIMNMQLGMHCWWKMLLVTIFLMKISIIFAHWVDRGSSCEKNRSNDCIFGRKEVLFVRKTGEVITYLVARSSSWEEYG